MKAENATGATRSLRKEYRLPLPPWKLQFRWTTNAVGYRLEASPSLRTTAWAPVDTGVAQHEVKYTMEAGTAGFNRFFRLSRP